MPNDIENLFPYNEIIKQCRYLEGKYGSAGTAPYFNIRGILNDALLICGEDFFVDLDVNPGMAKKIIDYAFAIIYLIQEYNALNNRNQLNILMNCSEIMVSPNYYKDKLLEYDKEIYRHNLDNGYDFGLHHCGIIDKYLNCYKVFEHTKFLEVGWGSDINKVFDTFPNAVVQYIVNPVFLAESSKDLIRNTILGILDECRDNLYRLSLSVPDIEFATPDENIVELFECVSSNYE